MRFFGGPEIGFPRAAASIVNLLSVLRSLRLSGRAQPLLNSNVSLPFLSVLTGRGGYSLGGSAGARSWKCWPEASVTRIGACRGGDSMTSGRAGGGAAAAEGLHLALDGALRWPPVLVEHWACGHIDIQYRGGVRSSPSKTCRISFFIISQCLCH